MNRTRLLLMSLVAGLFAANGPAAASSIVTSPSDSIATSVGSVSGSVRRSSNSSGGDEKVAAGEYRVVAIEPLAARPGLVRVRLAPPAAATSGGELWLDLPEAAATRGALAADTKVRVSERPYGWEFARADSGAAFFLVLQDDWHRELASRPVSL